MAVRGKKKTICKKQLRIWDFVRVYHMKKETSFLITYEVSSVFPFSLRHILIIPQTAFLSIARNYPSKLKAYKEWRKKHTLNNFGLKKIRINKSAMVYDL